jgi:psiF repeat
MKKLLSLLALGLTLSLGAAHAAEEKAATPQQTKMGTCNAEAKGLKGEEFKAKRNECLKNKPAPAADGKTAQQTKMKTCNADAKGKKGDERKAFMKECLSAK